MKSMRVVLLALSLSLLFAGAVLAQDQGMGSGMGSGAGMMSGAAGTTGTMMGADMMKGHGHEGMKALLDKNGKITKDEFMDLAKQRAETAWKKLDPEGKGVVTKEEMEAKRQERREKHMMKKNAMPQ